MKNADLLTEALPYAIEQLGRQGDLRNENKASLFAFSHPFHGSEINFGLAAPGDSVEKVGFKAAFLQSLLDGLQCVFLLGRKAQGFRFNQGGRRQRPWMKFLHFASPRCLLANLDGAYGFEAVQGSVKTPGRELP